MDKNRSESTQDLILVQGLKKLPCWPIAYTYSSKEKGRRLNGRNCHTPWRHLGSCSFQYWALHPKGRDPPGGRGVPSGPSCARLAAAAAQSSAGTKAGPAPPIGDPHHVSMGAGTHRFLQGPEVLTLLERLRRQKCSHKQQWIRGCSDWQKMHTARVPEVHVTFNKLMGIRNTKPHLSRFGFFCKIAHLM